MVKRYINKQQSTRIEKNQQNYLHSKAESNLYDGLVISRFSKHAEIEDEQGQSFRCSIRPNLELIVAGDRILWQKEGANQGVIVSIYPRSSILERPNYNNVLKPVAANITQLMIVVAPKPEISWPLLDSYLVLAELLNLKAVIILNKIDLPSIELQNELITIYRKLNYDVIFVSSCLNDTIKQLKKSLNNQVSVFVGQSGVGKSSLISHCLPYVNTINTSPLSEISELGKHTTSNSKYYHVGSNGGLIDSPGVREFSLLHVNAERLVQGYCEFRPFSSQCKYRNCSHKDTPSCAITDAVKSGLISQKRYSNFMKLSEQFS